MKLIPCTLQRLSHTTDIACSTCPVFGKDTNSFIYMVSVCVCSIYTDLCLSLGLSLSLSLSLGFVGKGHSVPTVKIAVPIAVMLVF